MDRTLEELAIIWTTSIFAVGVAVAALSGSNDQMSILSIIGICMTGAACVFFVLGVVFGYRAGKREANEEWRAALSNGADPRLL